MATLFDEIRDAVDDERFIVGNHADERLRQRRIELWQVLAELDEAILVEERPLDAPNPSIVLEQSLPDGTEIRVVWAWIARSRLAKLVTVHFI